MFFLPLNKKGTSSFI